MSAGISLTKENFDLEVLKSPLPVLVDFWAQWCGPCKMIGPIIDQLAGEYEGKIKIGKVNIDEENELAEKHGIVSIPTIVLYKDGVLINQKSGAAPKHDLISMFKDFL